MPETTGVQRESVQGDRQILSKPKRWRADLSAILAVSLLTIIFFAGIWDVYVTFAQFPEATVSEIIQSWALRFPIIPFLAGLLLGHLFWPIRRL